jgi:hypothetical protein
VNFCWVGVVKNPRMSTYIYQMQFIYLFIYVCMYVYVLYLYVMYVIYVSHVLCKSGVSTCTLCMYVARQGARGPRGQRCHRCPLQDSFYLTRIGKDFLLSLAVLRAVCSFHVLPKFHGVRHFLRFKKSRGQLAGFFKGIVGNRGIEKE